ncbi:Ig-like domain-containing protein [Nitrospira sp. MA-1]|nr:Ig-like domain-containing protein [Nitrospira sp. MA-1]
MPTNPSSPSTTVSGLSAGTTYGFIATAFDTAGNESAPSTERQISVPTGTSPPAPSTLNISNLTVSSGKTYVVPPSGLQIGGTVYIDRTYTFTTVPTLVQGARYIQTANNDKAATNSTFLSFTVNQPVSVYVAHGDRITSKPSWLSTFTDTGANLVTSDATFSLFVRSFPAGTITLGGNASGGGFSMYSVIVKPQSGTPGDTTSPTVTLTAPSAGTVSGTVTVSASASDNVGVAGVQFRLQGANLGPEDTTNPYNTSWNTTTVPNGSYTLTAIARDAAGNTKTATARTVTVSNTSTPPADTTAPTVTLTAPSAGTVSGTVTVTASASDNVGVAGVQFRLQGANLGPEDTTNPYSTSWNTTTMPNGSYTLTGIARDAAGNTTTSASRTVTVSNASPPPAPPPSSPLNISNLAVSSGKAYVLPTSGLQAGATVYIDRAYTFATVPTLVQGATYIRTANDDKAATNTAFLSFTVNQPVSVYVAHGDRITSKPSWLSTFTDTGTNLVTSDATFSLFVRSFPAGTITLGGNASGGCCSMYSVSIKPEGGNAPPAGDTTPPTVTLTAPSAGTVSGTVTVSASASDNVGVTGVQFRLQGANLGPEDMTNPYNTSWNTTTVPNGSYTLTAIARDAAGNTKTATARTVTVSNTSAPPPPPLSPLNISNLSVSSGKAYVLPTSGLQAGATVYIDRSYTFATVPTLVQGGAYIRTANDDKAATNSTFLSFTVNQPVSVYVAHGDRITSKPSWLSTFTDTGTNLVTSDATFSLFVKSFPAGTITLGGNVSNNNAGNDLSMYSVIVKQ